MPDTTSYSLRRVLGGVEREPDVLWDWHAKRVNANQAEPVKHIWAKLGRIPYMASAIVAADPIVNSAFTSSKVSNRGMEGVADDIYYMRTVAQYKQVTTSDDYWRRTRDLKSYMWLYRTSGDAQDQIVLYEYKPDRKAEHPKAFLKNFHGYLHADGYSGYHDLPNTVTVVGCWAYARRKFDEVLDGMPEKARGGSMAAGSSLPGSASATSGAGGAVCARRVY